MESNYWPSPKNTKEGLGEHRTNLSNTCISFNPVDKTSEADAVIAIENCIRDVNVL